MVMGPTSTYVALRWTSFVRRRNLRSCVRRPFHNDFPPPPPAYVLSALGTPITPIRLQRERLDFGENISTRRPPNRSLGRSHLAKPHHAGGRRGKECAARYERSNDWRRGARRAPPTRTTSTY